MVRRSITAMLLTAVAGSVSGCEAPTDEPWVNESQQSMYGESQIERQDATAEELRHRLRYRVAGERR